MDSKETAQIERGGFAVLIALLTLGLAYIAWPFASPLLWAALAAIMFQPLYQWFLARLGGRTNRAALATLAVITVAVLLPALFIGSLVIEEAAGVVIAFQQGKINVADWFAHVLAALPQNIQASLSSSGLGDLASVQAKAQQFLTESAGLIARQAVAFGGGVFGFVLAFGVGLYVTFFLLRDGRSIGTAIQHALPLEPGVSQEMAGRFLSIVRATIKGSVVVGLVQGALGAITFWIVGMPSIMLLGVLMAVFSLLPALGPAIIWAPVAIYLLATGAIWQGVLVLVSGVAVIGMADNVLRPILVGRDTGIPDWIILITTLGGIAAMGLAGIVVGPLVAGLFLAGWSMIHANRTPAVPPQRSETD